MSADATQVQANFDALTALVTDDVPKLIKLANDLFAENQTLRAGGAPTLDPAKVQADIDAITAAVQSIPTVIQNDTPPADSGSSSSAPSAPTA